MVKIAVIADPRLFELVERHRARLLQERFAGDRAPVVASGERRSGSRRLTKVAAGAIVVAPLTGDVTCA
jgi:hypothetical protein